MDTIDIPRAIVATTLRRNVAARRVLAGKLPAKASANPYDWLGNGIYFWEHGPAESL